MTQKTEIGDGVVLAEESAPTARYEQDPLLRRRFEIEEADLARRIDKMFEDAATNAKLFLLALDAAIERQGKYSRPHY